LKAQIASFSVFFLPLLFVTRAEVLSQEGWANLGTHPDTVDDKPCNSRCDNGVCKKYPDSDEKYCECPTATDDSGLVTHGFQGYKCEIAFQTCRNGNNQYWRCYNDSVCGYDVSCTCNSDEYSGRFCEIVKMHETMWEKETGVSLNHVTCPKECINGGSCKFHGDTGEYFCDCPLVESDNGFLKQGYTGPTCETKFVNCHSHNSKSYWRCYNNAVCGHDVKCDCDSDGLSSGQFCEILADGYLEASREAQKISSQNSILRREYEIAIFFFAFAAVAYKIVVEMRMRKGISFPFTHDKLKTSRGTIPFIQPEIDGETTANEDDFVVPLSMLSKEPNLRSREGQSELENDLLNYEVSMIDVGKKSRFSARKEKTAKHSSEGEFRISLD